jgi:hypothetical protein
VIGLIPGVAVCIERRVAEPDEMDMLQLSIGERAGVAVSAATAAQIFVVPASEMAAIPEVA